TFSSVNSESCVALVPDEVLLVGADAITRGAQNLGPATRLDTDQGCAELALEIDRSKTKGELRIGVDASTKYARVACLARAFAATSLFDPKMGKSIRRKPRCKVQWVTLDEHGYAPECASMQIVGDECPVPTNASRTFVAVTPRAVQVQGRDSIASYALPAAR